MCIELSDTTFYQQKQAKPHVCVIVFNCYTETVLLFFLVLLLFLLLLQINHSELEPSGIRALISSLRVKCARVYLYILYSFVDVFTRIAWL